MVQRAEYLRTVKRIVVKVGTSIISTEKGGLDTAKLKSLVDQVAQLKKQDYQVLLVTSGAIAAGVDGLRLGGRPKAIPKLQAAASVGQGLLLEQYNNLFKRHDVKVGQVLLTQYDFIHREHYLNARNTLDALLELGTMPVINENDTTAVDEIRYGDNDTLAALVANLVDAQLLILLTDTEGLYTQSPGAEGESKLIDEVSEITEEIEESAGGVGTKFGSGGMITKLQAAKIVTFAQSGMIIADGRKPDTLLKIIGGQSIGTFFIPREKKIDSRRLWIAFGKTARGTVYVDQGAKDALVSGGKSLLPAGVVGVEGEFEVGDAINIADENECVFGKGLTSYDNKVLNDIKGMRTQDIMEKFSSNACDEVIHRDCLVILV